jgi:hypothetical protein
VGNPKIQLSNLIPKGKFQPLEIFIETMSTKETTLVNAKDGINGHLSKTEPE